MNKVILAFVLSVLGVSVVAQRTQMLVSDSMNPYLTQEFNSICNQGDGNNTCASGLCCMNQTVVDGDTATTTFICDYIFMANTTYDNNMTTYGLCLDGSSFLQVSSALIFALFASYFY